jgi:hypothetical protein
VIALASDCLRFQTASGESIPYSAGMVADELAGSGMKLFDPEFVHHAASAVFHYFKHELGCQAVSVGEFAGALENVLRGLAVIPQPAAEPPARPGVVESDLSRLARESGDGGELIFFPRLRSELRQHLQQGPSLLHFHGLRGCVKHLAGVSRWNQRCQNLAGQIVAYLRECLSAEPGLTEVALVVE